MEPVFSLAYLTAVPLSPPEAISLAADLGYGCVGLRVAPAVPGGDYSPLIGDAVLRRETRARLAATGVAVFDVEILRLGAGVDLAGFAPIFDLCGDLGARAVLVAGDDPDEARLTDAYARLCAMARPYGVTADLEFMPWTAVKDATSAHRIVAAAGQPNGGILVDALHAARSSTTLADLAALPAEWIHYIQLCDAPADIPTTVEGLLHTARSGRLLPGDGGIDLAGLLRALPAGRPISLELPNPAEKARRGVRAWAAAALDGARRVVQRAGTGEETGS